MLKPVWELPEFQETTVDEKPEPTELEKAIELAKLNKLEEIGYKNILKWLKELQSSLTMDNYSNCDCRKDPRATGKEIR